jgi:hypothetical protein
MWELNGIFRSTFRSTGKKQPCCPHPSSACTPFQLQCSVGTAFAATPKRLTLLQLLLLSAPAIIIALLLLLLVLTCHENSAAASSHAPGSSSPAAAAQPIRGGMAPTTAPTQVLKMLSCLRGV